MSRALVVQASAGVLLAALLARCTFTPEPMPGWDGNPFLAVTAITGLGPAGMLVLDGVIAATAGLICLASRRRLGWAGLVASIAAAAGLLRVGLLHWTDVEPWPVAGAWISGACAFAGGAVVAQRIAVRRFAVSVVLGFMCILLAKSAGQLLVEHPAVVASFEADRDAVLAARGMDPGSAAAGQFERRLRQPDITAWFGLANVLAAFLVAGCLGLALTAWQARTLAKGRAWWVVVALAGCCLAGVVVTGSKAGLGVIAAASLAVVIAQATGRSIGRLAAIGVWVLPVAAVVGRGVLLPSTGERSLLFRWFYLETALEVAARALPWGTGADGFRASYQVLKPEIATESVTSAHNAIADWTAMLGIAGLPMVCLLAIAVWHASSGIAARPRVRVPLRIDRRLVLTFFGVLAPPVMLSAVLEAEATPIELALVRLLGLCGAVLFAACVWTLQPGRAVAAILALVLATHAQLDMLLFHTGSTPMALFLLGLAVRPAPRRASSGFVGPVLVTVSAGLLVLAVRAWSWEGPLRSAFASAQVVAVAAEQQNGAPGISARYEAERAISEADERLREAALAMPGDARAWLAVSELRLWAMGPGEAAWDAAAAAVDAERTPTTLGRLARVSMAIAERADTSQRGPWINRARDAWTEAAGLDPHGPHFPALLAELELSVGDDRAAERWSREALRRDASFSLDPLAGLPDERRERLRSVLDGPATGS